MRLAATAAAFVALVVASGCASVLGIPGDSPSFCARPENQGHDYCEDFDVGDATRRWTYSLPGGTLQIAPSDDSPPNLVDMTSVAGPMGKQVTGFDKEFVGKTFVGLHVEADVRFATPNAGPLTAVFGFLLVVDKAGGCIGLAITPGGIGAVVAPNAAACSGLTQDIDGGIPGGIGPEVPITALPPLGAWLHITVVVRPDASKNDGSGVLTFDIRGLPSASRPVPLDPHVLEPSGVPLVGFAAEANAGNGAIDVQYDNITVDVAPQ